MTMPNTSDHGTPSAWVRRFVTLVPADGTVLDLACGRGRHTRLFLERGHPVVAVDRDLAGVRDLAGHDDLELIQADLEDGSRFPLTGRTFAGVVIANYLHRPLLPEIIKVVAPGGVLIYETFADSDEPGLAGPTNPDFLLRPGELLDTVRGGLHVVAYEDTIDDGPPRAARQRITAVAR